VLVGLGYTLAETQLLLLEQTPLGTPVAGVAEDCWDLAWLVPPLVVPTTAVLLLEVRGD
jgi:hypothetical protein